MCLCVRVRAHMCACECVCARVCGDVTAFPTGGGSQVGPRRARVLLKVLPRPGTFPWLPCCRHSAHAVFPAWPLFSRGWDQLHLVRPLTPNRGSDMVTVPVTDGRSEQRRERSWERGPGREA